MMVNSFRFKFPFYISAIALLVIFSAGALHFHVGGGFHKDCPLCILYASLSIVLIPALIFILILPPARPLSETPQTSHHTQLLTNNHTSRAPPLSC